MSNREQVVLNDRYELQRRVGRGGMAEVFLARDRLLDRPVAIKILFPEFATDPSFVARFRREAQRAANLTHPNIVGVYDWGKERGTYYIVMEYVDGRTVSELIRAEGPTPPKRAAQIAADTAAALGFAHQKGVVHRDVKPGNILITRSGEVKVADFGIARAMTSSAEENLTQTGSVMGTATYFSPEQAQGKQVDARSDLYSLGVVLYEMVSGRPPFTADSPVAIAYKHVQEPLPPLHDRVPSVPDDYEAITVKALEKDPDARYPDAKAMRADLVRFVQGRPVEARAVGAAGAVAAGAAATGATTVVGRTGGAVPPTTGEFEAVEYEEDEVVYPADPPNRTGWFVAAVILLLLILGGLVWAFGNQLGIFGDSTEQVSVPNVVGKSVIDATDDLTKAGLIVKTEPVVDYPADKDPNEVLEQDPAGGVDVDKGSTVTLKVAQAPTLLLVPDVTKLTYDQAVVELEKAGFTQRPELILVPNEEDAGRIFDQMPKAGEQVDPSTKIQLYQAILPQTSTTAVETTTTIAETTTVPTTVPPSTVPPSTAPPSTAPPSTEGTTTTDGGTTTSTSPTGP